MSILKWYDLMAMIIITSNLLFLCLLEINQIYKTTYQVILTFVRTWSHFLISWYFRILTCKMRIAALLCVEILMMNGSIKHTKGWNRSSYCMSCKDFSSGRHLDMEFYILYVWIYLPSSLLPFPPSVSFVSAMRSINTHKHPGLVWF